MKATVRPEVKILYPKGSIRKPKGVQSKNTRQDQSALSDWLDEVPANKIMSFGGDYLFVEGAYGHPIIARQNVATVLASKVDEGVYSMDQAKKYARWLLRENAESLFLKPFTR